MRLSFLLISLVPRINGPAVIADGCVISSGFNRLDVAGVACPTDCLQIVIVEKQIQVTFVRLDVVNDCRMRVASALLEHSAAAVVLAPKAIPKQRTAA